MKVKLLVNLKLDENRIEHIGTVYSDANGPFPEFVTEALANSQIFEVIDATPAITEPEFDFGSEEVPIVTPKISVAKPKAILRKHKDA